MERHFEDKHSRSYGATSMCFDCCRLNNIAIARHDMGFYRLMLQNIRNSETALSHEVDPVIHKLSEIDLKLVLETIWQISSAISGRQDLYDLKFVRWDKNRPWSPWNCILLTRQEATVHLRLLNRKIYSEALTTRIEMNHQRARDIFAERLSKPQSAPTICKSRPSGTAIIETPCSI
ncbi:hypothetical protein RvY_03937-2 [Ramazzottius varieornatus]|nr:hypothetical protein RvY_03937-2 [Ramazzottius varieornatus]